MQTIRLITAASALSMILAGCAGVSGDEAADSGSGESDSTTLPVGGGEGSGDTTTEGESGETDGEPGNLEGGEITSPAQGGDAAEACAMVEFGYLLMVDGETGDDVALYLTEGAFEARSVDDERYRGAGEALEAALGTEDAQAAADSLLEVCAEDGFERLG